MFFVMIICSIAIHVLGFLVLHFHDVKPVEVKKIDPVKLHIVAQVSVEEKPKEVKKPLKNLENPIKKHKVRILKSLSKNTTTTPQMGLSKSSFAPSDSKSSISAPVGNTLEVPDNGKRLEEVQELAGDQSHRATLIAFEKPKYTSEATEASLEGSYILDVHISENGSVLEAELREPIGFKMDELLIQAALKSKFSPRKNEKGDFVDGWDEIVVKLELP